MTKIPTIDSEEQGDSKSPQLGEQPEQVKSLTVEEAYRRGVIDATGGLAIPNLMNHQKSRNTAFKKYAIKFFNTKIKERRERLLGASVNDLATSNLACNAGVTNPQKAAQEANKAVEAKNYAYWERNQLVGVLSRLYPSHLARHDENDKEWEDDWRNIVCVHTPVGQATWHLQDNDMPMFAHLKRGADHWDGHTTEEKYHRLAQLTADKEQA